MNPTNPTPEQLANRMKPEIRADVACGRVPRVVSSFSHLHDFVDANCYGGTEKMLEKMDATGPDTHEQHVANLARLCDLCNPAMDIVDQWIKDGGLRRDCGTWQATKLWQNEP